MAWVNCSIRNCDGLQLRVGLILSKALFWIMATCFIHQIQDILILPKHNIQQRPHSDLNSLWFYIYQSCYMHTISPLAWRKYCGWHIPYFIRGVNINSLSLQSHRSLCIQHHISIVSLSGELQKSSLSPSKIKKCVLLGKNPCKFHRMHTMLCVRILICVCEQIQEQSRTLELRLKNHREGSLKKSFQSRSIHFLLSCTTILNLPFQEKNKAQILTGTLDYGQVQGQGQGQGQDFVLLLL